MSTPPTVSLDDPRRLLRSVIQRIATGPELSKDISFEEATAAMRAILEGDADPVQAAIVLIALRMKRETRDENRGVLQAILDTSERVIAPVDEVVDIADPYDGYNRTLPPSPFLPAVLAACGIPAIAHGVETMGPKFGITTRQVLRAAGVPVDLTTREAAQRLAGAGWAYVDQAAFAPRLHDLTDLRRRIVKRPAITTVEVLVGPVRGRTHTHLMTGYVHKPYPPIYAMLARHAGFDSAMLVRGVEGGVIPSLRQAGKLVHFRDGAVEAEVDLDPTELDIVQEQRSVPFPQDLPPAPHDDEIGLPVDAAAAARAAVACGLEALEGRSGATRDGLVYAGAICLWHLGHAADWRTAASKVREAIDSGRAMARFRAGCA